MTQTLTGSTAEDKALNLLGSGIPVESVASALGVSASRISQLLADENFAAQVAELRYKNLQSHNTRDSAYDTLEDKLLKKLDKTIPFLIKPAEILKAIQVVNAAKRRGQSAPEQVTNQQNIVTILLPTQITQKFTTNIDNQVTVAGGQSLETMQSGNLLALAEQKAEQKTLPQEAPKNDKVQTHKKQEEINISDL